MASPLKVDATCTYVTLTTIIDTERVPGGLKESFGISIKDVIRVGLSRLYDV